MSLVSFEKSMCVKSVSHFSHVWFFVIPWIVAHQAPLSMEFSRQEYWSGLPFPSPGDLPNPGIEPGSLTLQAVSLLSEPPGKPSHTLMCTQISQGSCYNTQFWFSSSGWSSRFCIFNELQVVQRTLVHRPHFDSTSRSRQGWFVPWDWLVCCTVFWSS